MEDKTSFAGLIEFEKNLRLLKPEFEGKLKNIEEKSEKVKDMDSKIKEVISSEGNSIISIQVGEKVFKTKLKTLLSRRDSIFYRYIYNELVVNQPYPNDFFFDRSPTYFSLLLDYLRTGVLNYEMMTKKMSSEFLIELEFYGIWTAVSCLKNELQTISVINFFSSNRYSNVGTFTLQGISDENSKEAGICVESPYEICFELNMVHLIGSLDIKGYAHNTNSWGPSNGENAEIFISESKTGNYTKVGNIPYGFGTDIKNVKFNKPVFGKYVKFKHSSYLGIGYIKFNK